MLRCAALARGPTSIGEGREAHLPSWTSNLSLVSSSRHPQRRMRHKSKDKGDAAGSRVGAPEALDPHTPPLHQALLRRSPAALHKGASERKSQPSLHKIKTSFVDSFLIPVFNHFASFVVCTQQRQAEVVERRQKRRFDAPAPAAPAPPSSPEAGNHLLPRILPFELNLALMPVLTPFFFD